MFMGASCATAVVGVLPELAEEVRSRFTRNHSPLCLPLSQSPAVCYASTREQIDKQPDRQAATLTHTHTLRQNDWVLPHMNLCKLLLTAFTTRKKIRVYSPTHTHTHNRYSVFNTAYAFGNIVGPMLGLAMVQVCAHLCICECYGFDMSLKGLFALSRCKCIVFAVDRRLQGVGIQLTFTLFGLAVRALSQIFTNPRSEIQDLALSHNRTKYVATKSVHSILN